jgi:hypothetical protein
LSNRFKAVYEKEQGEEIIRLLTEIDEYIKINNDILKADRAVILSMAEDVRKIKINTQ